MLRASRLPLLKQLQRTPAEWQPRLISSHAVDGALQVTYREAAACCDAMHAVREVHTLTLQWSDALPDPSEAGPGAQRACAAVTSLPTLRILNAGESYQTALFGPVAHSLVSALTRLTDLLALRTFWRDASPAVLARPLGLLTTLTRLHLDIETNCCQESALELAPALTCLSRLAHVTLGCGGRGEVTALGPALGTLTTLTSLDLSGNASVDADAYVNVEGVSVCYDVEAFVHGLRHLSQLAALNLACGYVGSGFDSGFHAWHPAGAALLAQALSQLTALTGLILSSDYIDAGDAASLAPALTRLSRLAHLDLGFNVLGAAGAAALAPSIALLTALTRLHLDGNDVGANGAAALAPALSRLSRLAELKLCWNELGGAGCNALAPPLGCLTALTLLRLGRNRIDDDDLQHLAPALARLTRLKGLCLGGNPVHDSAVDALRAHLPASVCVATKRRHLNRDGQLSEFVSVP